jgi:heme-degrading monooxygenase HmoA
VLGRADLFEEWDLPASQEAYLALRGERSQPGEPPAEGEPAPEPLDKAALGVMDKFEAPDIASLTDAVPWDITGEKTTGEVGFHIAVEINAADEAKYAELLAWSQSEDGLAFTASQKGILSMRSYKKGATMFIFEEWESAEAQAAYMAVREEQGTLAKMVESGTLNAENPFRAIPLTLISTYKAELPAEPEPEPAAESAAEPEAEQNPALGLPPSGEAPVPASAQAGDTPPAEEKTEPEATA